MPQQRRRRFAVIDCEDSPKWENGFAAYMKPAFSEAPEEEEWTVFRLAVDGGLPSPDDNYDGVIITGSHYNVRDAKPWQERLFAYVRAVVAAGREAEAAKGAAEPEAAPSEAGGAGAMPSLPPPAPPRHVTRLVGVCYGHQAIGASLGGVVDYNPGRRFVLRSERLTPTPALAAQPFAAGLVEAVPSGDSTAVRVRDVTDDAVGPATPSAQLLAEAARAGWTDALGLLESHGDCVADLPPGATLLASSPSCAHELVLHAPNALSVQGHPEFDYQSAIVERIWPAVVDTNHRLSPEEAAEARGTFARPRHSRLLLEMMRRFLRG